MRIIRAKKKLRDYIRAHALELPRMNYLLPIWGKGARRAAYRATQHMRTHGEDIERGAGLTPELYDRLCPPSFGRLVVRLAAAEVGVTEHPAGSNDGPRVHDYQATTGAYKAPWCASFVRWLYGLAARRLHREIKWFTNPAWVPNWTAAAGGQVFCEVAFEDARPGDFVTLWGSKHIEVVVKRMGDYLICIGGNTSPVGQNANGGMVARTKRHRSEVTTIGRLRS
jgi:hypothetical protein